MHLLCHPWLTTISPIGVLLLKLPPRPCAVLLVMMIIYNKNHHNNTIKNGYNSNNKKKWSPFWRSGIQPVPAWHTTLQTPGGFLEASTIGQFQWLDAWIFLCYEWFPLSKWRLNPCLPMEPWTERTINPCEKHFFSRPQLMLPQNLPPPTFGSSYSNDCS